MDLNTLRINYAIGAYSSITTSASTTTTTIHTPESICLIWKSILRATAGDLTKCVSFLQQSTTTLSDSLKKALMMWSKAYKSRSALKPDEIVALSGLAQESSELEERDQIILTCAEALLMSSAINDAFKLLKLLKASNLDSQVMYVDILVQLGQVQLAQDRLEKMKNIPEWKDDVRFLLSEALLGLHSNNDAVFSAKDALYSYQELIQVHGATPLLLLHLAAGYVLIGKHQEANNTLNQINDNSEIVEANLLVTSALLNNPSFKDLSCSVACCKVHKGACVDTVKEIDIPTATADTKVVVGTADVVDTADTKDTLSTVPAVITLPQKIAASIALNSFLTTHPYLLTQLPVLLARIDRTDTSSTSSSHLPANPATSQLTRDLERRERIRVVLGEAIDTDPQVAELFKILQDENLI